MAVPARDVAAAIRERLPGIPTKKLHKLLYFAQGHHLATFHRPLFTDTISAYDMGPVVPRLWRAEKDDGPRPASAVLDEDRLNTVGYVVSRYGGMSGRDLEILSHGQSPWQRADESREPHGSVRIESSWIEEYFSEPDADDDGAQLEASELAGWLAGARTRLSDESRPDDLDELRARIVARA